MYFFLKDKDVISQWEPSEGNTAWSVHFISAQEDPCKASHLSTRRATHLSSSVWGILLLYCNLIENEYRSP